MRRWNGWGEETTTYPLPASAARYLEAQLGPGEIAPDAPFEAVLARLPAPRLPPHPLISTAPEDRLRHARGQSLPDWIALRSGRIETFPDGVAYPVSEEQVRSILGYARQFGVRLIPYGGGTSVVGHVNPPAGDLPCLTVDLTGLNRPLGLDETSRLATFEAGVRGPALEGWLRARGYTLGHYPQSFECSTLGGWIAARSSGQQSYYYGRIEHLFAGGHLETPIGPLDLLPYPASAAGPDLRQLVLGAEGRLGVLTRATVRVRRLPEAEGFYGVFFHAWEEGLQAARAMAQEGLPFSMLRLSDPVETETSLALSGKERLLALARRGLGLLGYGERRCLMVFCVTGERRAAGAARERLYARARAFGGLPVGSLAGEAWRKSRFLTPYLRNTLWECGYALDTLETAVPWAAAEEAAASLKRALLQTFAANGERALVFAHLSHLYPDGVSLYFTCLFRRSADPEQMLQTWQSMKAAASQAILACGGTISHQHGIGRDHAPYLPAEKGEVGLALLRSAAKAVDPQGLLNPGALFGD